MAKTEVKQKTKANFFKGARSEMKKVIWPTKKELRTFTGVVLFTCVFFSLGVWLLDSIFSAILKLIVY